MKSLHRTFLDFLKILSRALTLRIKLQRPFVVSFCGLQITGSHVGVCKAAVVIALSLAAACGAPMTRPESPTSQILFVCEHGNVKSLMAASYFNQLAQERGLPLRAISRGSAPDSDTVPAAIREALKGDGFDVSPFHPVAVSTSDISTSHRVVIIGTTLPASVGASGVTLEHWDDVPPASVNYAASRESLKAHVKQLIDQLAPQTHK